MRRPFLAAVASVLLVAGLSAVPSTSSQAVAGSPTPWCSGGRPAPCLERLWRDGVELTSSDPTYGFLFLEDQGWDPPTGGFWWEFTKNAGYDMGSAELGHEFRALVNNGARQPRTTFGFARGVSVRLLPDTGSGYRVDLTVRPVSMIFSCKTDAFGTTTCPHTGAEGDTVEAMAYGAVDDASWWGRPSIRNQLKGLELFTNVHMVSMPPEFTVAPDGTTSMSMLLQNSHAYFGGTLFEGFAHYRVPHRLLHEVFGIPAPSTMTGSSLVATVSGTTAPASFTQDDDAVIVDIGPITFSKRKVRIATGTITPTRPHDVRAKRVSPTAAKVKFGPATPRGARVTGYTARCQRPDGSDRETGTGDVRGVKVTGLQAGKVYQCRVRARSSVGPGKWSPWVKVPRRPPT